jgi:hypothetical protein
MVSRAKVAAAAEPARGRPLATVLVVAPAVWEAAAEEVGKEAVEVEHPWGYFLGTARCSSWLVRLWPAQAVLEELVGRVALVAPALTGVSEELRSTMARTISVGAGKAARGASAG